MAIPDPNAAGSSGAQTNTSHDGADSAPDEARSFAPDLFGETVDGRPDPDLDDDQDEDTLYLDDDLDGALDADDEDDLLSLAGDRSGACADDVPDTSHPRQEALLDEGIEESFPASDPVSVKRIT